MIRARVTVVTLIFVVVTSGIVSIGRAKDVLKNACPLSLTLIPPSPVSDAVELDVRAAIHNHGDTPRSYNVAFYLDVETPETLLYRERCEVTAGAARGVMFRWRTKGKQGKHRIVCVSKRGSETLRTDRPITILARGHRSTQRLGGAWVDIYHHDEAEGRPFNAELAKTTDDDWRQLVRAMHAIDQNILVITMMFQNFTHVGRHQIEKEGYHGKAYYPSKLYPGRMPIASQDPLKAILDEADALGMHVMPGVGCYAFFDFTPGSLAWHKQVADELWQRYGHHRSFFGWYVSDEIAGNLGSDDRRRRELVGFFREFRAHVRKMAPDKPVMLATNSHFVHRAGGYYPKLLAHVDILCPFGFHRMPAGDMTGEQAAAMLQKLCDDAGCHLWMDIESFVFRNGVELHPRSIDGLVSDLARFPNFEKILHYQFPGMMCSPKMSHRPGGEASVRLYLDYRKFLKDGPPGEKKAGANEKR